MSTQASPKDSTKSTWLHGDRSQWKWSHKLLAGQLTAHPEYDVDIPVHAKTDPMPVVAGWTLHVFVLLRALGTMLARQVYVLFTESAGHSGVRLLMNPPSTLDWLWDRAGLALAAEDHDMHHRRGSKKSFNYGKQTLVWDHLFGTVYPREETPHADRTKVVWFPMMVKQFMSGKKRGCNGTDWSHDESESDATHQRRRASHGRFESFALGIFWTVNPITERAKLHGNSLENFDMPQSSTHCSGDGRAMSLRDSSVYTTTFGRVERRVERHDSATLFSLKNNIPSLAMYSAPSM